MIKKADNGNSIIVLYIDHYNSKIGTFISNNDFTRLTHDITNNSQRDIRAVVNECQSIIQKEEKWKYINLNPTAPTIRGLVKVHKEDSPVRPMVNWINALAYKLTKMLVKNLQTYIP